MCMPHGSPMLALVTGTLVAALHMGATSDAELARAMADPAPVIDGFTLVTGASLELPRLLHVVAGASEDAAARLLDRPRVMCRP